MAGPPVAITEIKALISSFGQGPEASQKFAAFALAKRDEVIAKDNPSTVIQYVDGSRDAPISSVHVPGVVRFEFDYLREAVSEIYNMLIQASPYANKSPSADVKTHYKDENIIFVDGVETDDITNISASSVVVFANLQPYSRKIEGMGSRPPLSLQAPNGVYEQVARQARARFGNSANISFGFDIFPGAGPNKSSVVRTNRAKSRADDRFPTITVKAIE